MVDAQQSAVDGIKTVGHIRKQHGPGLLQQPREGVREHFVRAVADEDLLGRDTMISGQHFSKARGLWVRVEAERVGRRRSNRFDRPWRWSKWVFAALQL